MIAEAIAGGIEVAQAVLNDKGTFTDYVLAIMGSRELVQFGVLLGAGLAGGATNYLYKWVRDEITGSLWAYVTEQYPKRTLLALMTYVGYCVATVLSPVLDGAGWGVVINMGFTTGFAIDALVNKSERKEWSAQERAVRVPPPDVPKP